MKAVFLSLALLAHSLLAQVPADADKVKDALGKSPRHGEWVDVALPGGGKLLTWGGYPERREKAGIVIVIHEIFGLTDWVRGVADQLAKEGFIALAPDLLSGMGPNGGGTDSLGADATKVIRNLTPSPSRSWTRRRSTTARRRRSPGTTRRSAPRSWASTAATTRAWTRRSRGPRTR